MGNVIDWQLTVIVLISVSAGLILAGLAVYLSTTQGNTMEAVQRAVQTGAPAALTIELPGGYRMSAGVPVVALYSIAAICAVGLPMYFINATRITPTTPVTIGGMFDQAPKEMRFIAVHANVNGNVFQLPFITRDGAQDFVADASPEFDSFTITTKYRSSVHGVTVVVGGMELGTWPIDSTNRVDIPPSARIALHRHAEVDKLPPVPAHIAKR